MCFVRRVLVRAGIGVVLMFPGGRRARSARMSRLQLSAKPRRREGME